MSILKLKEVGDEATLKVASCEVVQGEYGEQVKFTTGEDDLYLPRASADRQLERLGFGDAQGIQYQEVSNATLRFFRAPNSKPGSKPFWNIERIPDANGKSKPLPGKPAVMASKPNAELHPLLQNQEEEDAAELSKLVGFDIASLQKDLARYQAIAEWYRDKMVPIFSKGDPIGLTSSDVIAGVATIFINTAGKK